jgi:hypothetical protein
MNNQEHVFVKNVKELVNMSFSGNYEEAINSLKMVHGVQAFCFNHLHSKNNYSDTKLENCMKKVRDTYLIAGEQYILLNKF